MPVLVRQFPDVLDISNNEPTAVGGLRAALPVLGGQQWERFAHAFNWAVAQGGSLVLSGPSSGANAGSNKTWRFYVWPRYQIAARLWTVNLCMNLGGRLGAAATDLADWHASGTIVVAGLGHPWTIDQSSFGRTTTFHFVETVASPTADPGEVTVQLNVDASSGGAVFNDGICCYEIPRATLTTFGPNPSPYGAFHAFAPDPATDQTGALITEGFDQSRSVDGLFYGTLNAEMLQVETRRSCFFSSYQPTGKVQGTSYATMFARDPAILARYLGSPTATIAVAVYGSGPADSGMRFTTAAGASLLALPTSDAWTIGTLEVDTEDPARWATDGGIRAGTRDRVAIEARRVGGGTCTVYGVCMAAAT